RRRSPRYMPGLGGIALWLLTPALDALLPQCSSGFRSARLRLHLTLHDGPDDPGRELLLADTGELALAPLAGGVRLYVLEDLPPHLGQRRALEDHPAVDVHVLRHVAVHEAVGGELDRRHRLAAEHGAAPGGEADHVAAARHQTGDRHRVVPRRVHEDEAAGGDGLAVLEHVHHRRGAALGDAAQRLLADGGDAPPLLPRARLLSHLPLPAVAGLRRLVPPALVGRAAATRRPGPEVAGRLGAAPGPAVAHQLVHRPAKRRVRGDAGGAVGAAAVGGEADLRDRLLRAA